jgi:hypothetical protein
MTALYDVAPFTQERPEPETATISLPFFAKPYPGGYGGWMATAEQRMTVLGRLFAQEGHDLAEVPKVHTDRGPLSSWCWLVLVVNGITPEFMSNGEPYSLIHYGIDLGFSSTGVREWTFWLA